MSNIFSGKGAEGNRERLPASSEKQYSVPSRMARVFVAVIMCGAIIITGLSAALIQYGSGS
ncbi:MAG: hypothetical protein IIY89_04130, partial [Clostridia bacterium]|nr:hypothetical protein [Clostridia bacterium]